MKNKCGIESSRRLLFFMKILKENIISLLSNLTLKVDPITDVKERTYSILKKGRDNLQNYKLTSLVSKSRVMLD